jgi:hypothetical protein
MKGVEQLRVKWLQNILVPNGALAYHCRGGSLDPKISCVILTFTVTIVSIVLNIL